ncbi:periplasmic chaperone for outer membrane proteins Skp [Chitinophaga sp. YR573]|uniref:OmpH family outer membrane protein n=1 Tax=Chitinophaga sp. YR573 TaxID=1881040 RepID=UPI0008ADB448|nr:OmpH family outer membrane protein [Chitinophaga sp. YR573]SEW37380.1 periplasmic chaperone for outer membrane proteins Skp [Chitinophaga sp. YR573]
MIKICTIALLVSFGTLISTRSNAQAKIAYINMQQLISSMPEAKRAYDTLQVFEQELNKDGQMLMTEFQAKVAAYQKDEPTLKADIKEVRLKELEASKTNIEDYKERMEQKIAAREQKLTIPIIAKAKKAVSDVAAEKGIVCVLDNSKDIVVSATCEDLLAPAKLKLGIK